MSVHSSLLSDSNYENCPCYSCSQFKNCHQIDFLTKPRETGTRNRSFHVSDASFVANQIKSINCLPDDVLIHIFQSFLPNNIINFFTLIGLETVSKRFRHYMNKANIWRNVTELVLGFHPDLPDSQYLCHIGHISLIPFLNRVPKITKLIVNFADHREWSCADLIRDRISPVLTEGFAKKFELQQLILDKTKIFNHPEGQYSFVGQILTMKLIENARESLEICHISANGYDEMLTGFLTTKCSFLKVLKVSFRGAVKSPFTNFVEHFLRSLDQLKSLQQLEISGFPQTYVRGFIWSLRNPVLIESPRFGTLRFTNSLKDHDNLQHFTLEKAELFLRSNNSRFIREFEIHLCTNSESLDYLPHLLRNAHLDHLLISFHPVFAFHETSTSKMIKLLENAQVKNDQMKISITFLHLDNDYEVKLSIIHHLLDAFDVPHGVPQPNQWEFIRRNLCVNLKLKKFTICCE